MKKTLKKTLLICLIFFFQAQMQAQQEAAEQAPTNDVPVETISNIGTKIQKPLGRIKSTTSVNSESSSFIGDPDNIDPLNPNRENLKDDEEPVLEDIKQIIDAPKKKKEIKKIQAAPTEQPVPTPTTAPVPPVQVEMPTASPKEKPTLSGLAPDDPDLNLEKKFNNIFIRYNINPTPDDIWAAATSKQVLREYVVQKGDTLWSISKILFDDASFWPKIWSLNKQGILNPHFIYPNSKIYFYMGDEESAPTLSVGTPAAEVNNEDQPLPDEEAGSETGDLAISKARPTTLSSAEKGKKRRSDRPTKLPDSLPLSRSEKYFGPPSKREVKIDLGEFPRFEYEFSSDIVITDRPVKEDVHLKIGETTKFRCYEGRIIRDIRYVGKLVEDYDIFERLSNIKTTAGTMYAYRVYGKAQPYQGKYLKISNCKSLLLTDLVFVAKEKIQTYKNKQISPSKKAVLIGGPDVVNQNLFAPNQVAYIDFGSFAFEPGQEFKIMSQITDEINGVAKVMEKFGSFAVVMLTDVNDVIAIGDKVILN